MTLAEYEKNLVDVVAIAESGNTANVEKKLELLKVYKPLRIVWFYVQARNHYNITGNQSSVYQELAGKYTLEYTYRGIKNCISFFCELEESRNNRFDIKRYEYITRAIQGDYSFYDTAAEKCSLVDETSDPETDFQAYWELYACRELVGYMIRQKARRAKYPDIKPRGEAQWVNNVVNMGYLKLALEKDMQVPFVAIETEQNASVIKLLCSDLRLLGKNVFLLKMPLIYEADNVRIEDTVEISIGSMEESGAILSFVPVELIRSNGSTEDNRGYLLHHINRKYNVGKMLHILSDGDAANRLSHNKKFCKEFSETLGIHGNGIHDRNLVLSWFGDYLSYISNIYGEDCHPLVEKTPAKRFSIVIPARNSSDTLRYTIQTCLEQRFPGDYEIIVSDNSTGHNAAVFELCQELNNPKIVYIKTPRDLPLSKSFEYAYLHASGEYIFALGSDDGLLPWALEILDGIISAYPEEEIIEWTRGFYAWPGFNGGQQHQFTIPGKCVKGELPIAYRPALSYIDAILQDPSNMYSLPMLYINSCFKRSYFNTLLDKTGRLWDGICQDIYMGVITACIHPQILNLGYPLSIAGMSPRSVGANANLGQKTNDEFEKMMKEVRADNNMGGYCPSYLEHFTPDTGSDVSSMYKCLLRAINIGVLPEQYLTEVFDWKKIFADIANLMDVRDVAFDRKIHEMRYAAMQHGEEFLAWFDKAIYEPALTPRVINEDLIQAEQNKRTYHVGPTKSGGMVLDASEYGVSNIYEAVKLFEKLTGL